eukprot:m.121119 g.121119  ORF g.121119 m.121119 type:complete len:136 (+) comp37749_c2_seq9:286-693(+)
MKTTTKVGGLFWRLFSSTWSSFPEACRFHPGDPYFHDAYKARKKEMLTNEMKPFAQGWSCCQKKSVDFTEFLNIAGCTVSFHSNVKPSEPEKPAKGKPMPPGEVRGTVKTSSRGEGGKTSMASKIKNLLKISGQI